MPNFTAEINMFTTWYKNILVSMAKFPLHDSCTGGEFLYNSPTSVFYTVVCGADRSLSPLLQFLTVLLCKAAALCQPFSSPATKCPLGFGLNSICSNYSPTARENKKNSSNNNTHSAHWAPEHFRMHSESNLLINKSMKTPH